MPVEWTLVGRPHAARHIAVSQTGAIYALNFDGALFVNEGGGADTEWKHLTDLPATTARIAAGGPGLYFIDEFSQALSVLNIARPGAGSWTTVGHKLAIDIAATEEGSLDFARVFALTPGPQKTLERTSSPTNASAWEYLTDMVHAVRIACSREWIYCLGSDSSDPGRRVLFRCRNGITDWENLGELWATVEITAATSGNTSEEYLYALNNEGALLPDYSLWRGRLTT